MTEVAGALHPWGVVVAIAFGPACGGEDPGFDTAESSSQGDAGDADTGGDVETGASGDEDGAGDGGDGDGDGDSPVDPCDETPGNTPLAIGERVRDVGGQGPDGESFRVCSWAGIPFVMDISALWCAPCHDVAAFLSGNGGTGALEPYGADIKSLLDAGQIRWLTVVSEGEVFNGGVTLEDAQWWEQAYPHPHVQVIMDEDRKWANYMQAAYLPTIHSVDGGMALLGLQGDDANHPLGTIVALFP